MPRGIFNWTYRDVTRFLKKHDFYHDRTSGSHHIYERILDDHVYTVVVPFHGNKGVIRPGTFKSIVAQSGIPLKEWLALGTNLRGTLRHVTYLLQVSACTKRLTGTTRQKNESLKKKAPLLWYDHSYNRKVR